MLRFGDRKGVRLLRIGWLVHSSLTMRIWVNSSAKGWRRLGGLAWSGLLLFGFRCVLHPLPLPLSSCLGCIPPLIGLPSLSFYAVASSLFLLSVCFCLCFLFYRDDVICWLLSCPFSSVCFSCLSPIPDLIWFGSVYLVTTARFVADQLM